MQRLKINKAPLHIQARQHLLRLVEDGTYQPGEQLPSEVDLATQLGISRPTLREALLDLERQGVIVRKHGVGTFVTPGYGRRLESGLECLESVLEMGARQGMEVSVQDLRVQEEPADPEVADRLKLDPGSLLTAVRRVITVDRTPVAYMLDLVPPSILSLADVDETFRGSVLDLLRRNPALRIAQAVADIIPVNADGLLIEKLRVRPDQAILLIEEVLFDEDGEPVEFSRNYFVPNFFRFHVVRR